MNDQYTDLDRADFLICLDISDTVEVNDWEANFLEANIHRNAIDAMIDNYASRIGWE